MPFSAMWRDALLILAATPLVYYALAILVAVQFFRKQRARPLPEYSPPVSLLKPVRGVDFGSYENFVSFCQQDYLEYEILFAVNDDRDPAVPSRNFRSGGFACSSARSISARIAR